MVETRQFSTFSASNLLVLLPPPCVTEVVADVQDFINQLISVETVITQARSLRAKFATCKKDEDTAEVDE